MSQPRSEQDSPWKEILRQYFQQALEFFFPQTAALIDWGYPVEFLDKEFQQITPEAEIGRRYADQLVKVHLKQGQELWIVVHLEIQAEPEQNFAERMYVYNFRIFECFHRPAISLAILCDSNRHWRPQRYEFAYPGTQLSFQFDVVKLLDYRERTEELEQSRNPFAVVVMAHLQAQATKRNATTRKQQKVALIRRLYEGGYERQDVIHLFRFIDWVMMLPEGLKREFWQELRAYEEERRMPYITSVEEIGFERGLEQGLERGLEQGLQHERTLVLRQLDRKLGTIPADVRSMVATLSLPQLEALGESLLDFASIDDLTQWLQTH
jgi:Domain of unknown function (DUF4351)